MAVLESTLGIALAIGLEVAEVTHVAGLVGTVTVCLVVGVDWQLMLAEGYPKTPGM